MNKIIIHDNKTCQFITDEEALLRVLRSNLSYKMAGVEYTQQYKNGWDGRIYLVSKKGIFYYGLLNKVKEFLAERRIEYKIDDERLPLKINKPLDISKNLKRLGFIPRDYQNRMLQVTIDNQNGIIRACTGSGKTLVIALATAQINKPTIVYVIGLDLLKQFHDLFTELFDEPIGYIGNGICNIERINIASVWTIGKSLGMKNNINDDTGYKEKFNKNKTVEIIKLLEKTKVHFFDESHVVVSNTIQAIYKKIDPEYIYGFSGTPYRDDNTDLLINGLLGEQIIDISASELIEKNFLAKPIIKFVAVPKMSLPSDPYQTVYKTYIVENDIRNTLIVKNVLDLLKKGYTPLVLFKQIKHGQILLDLIQKEKNIKCEMLSGNDSLKKRTEVKEKIENGEINVILASIIFDMGIDIPILSALVLAGSGKSSVRAIQRLGRILRKYPGKTIVAIVDFYDQVKFLKKHSNIRYNIYSSEKGFRVIKCKEMK